MLNAWVLPFGVALFAITVFRAEIIASPPYWDSAMGLFVEANFLADHGFDYRRLAMEEKSFVDGGPAVYIISVVPTVLAALMTTAPSAAWVLVIGHLLTFACAAAIFVMLYGLLEARVGSTGAIVASTAMLTTPLYVVQTDMIGMELPMIVFGMLTLVLLDRGWFAAAALSSLAAFSVKMSGGLLTAALVLYLAMLLVTGRNEKAPLFLRRCWTGLGVAMFVLSLEVGAMVWLNSLPNRAFKQYDSGTFDLAAGLFMPVMLIPDILLILLACLIGAAVVLKSWFGSLLPDLAGAEDDDDTTSLSAKDREPPSPHSPTSDSTDVGTAIASVAQEMDASAASSSAKGRSSISLVQLGGPLHAVLRGEGIVVYSWIVVLATIAALMATYTIPRYVALVVPFLYVIVTWLLFRLARPQVAIGVLAVLISLNIVNRRGVLFPDIAASEHRTGAFLERSLEYLDDHRANLNAVAKVVAESSDVPIVAANPFVHFLALPCLGYVERPLHGYAINSFTTRTFKPVEQILKDCPPQVVVISANNRFASPQTALSAVPLPETTDERIYVDDSRPQSPLIVFRKHWKTDDAKVIRTRYLSLLWPARYLDEQAAALAKSGRIEEAETLYRRAVEVQTADAEPLFQLALFLAHTQRFEQAVEPLEQAIRWDPQRAEFHHQLGVVLTELERYSAATEQLKKALMLNPRMAEAYCDLGVVRARLDDPDKAIADFSKALDVDPRVANAQRLWGKVLLKQEQFSEAIEHFSRAIELAPNDVEAYFAMAAADLKLGRNDDAEICFQQVLSNNPNNDEAHNQLAVIYEAEGRTVDAVRHYRITLRINPQRHDAANNVAFLIATQADRALGSGEEAVRLATYANKLTDYKEPAYLDTLAVALADSGKFEQAAETAQSAIALAESKGDLALAGEITKRLALYRDGQPYRTAKEAVQTSQSP